MSPPRIPPCPSCETMQRISNDAAALADLDQLATQTRADSGASTPLSPNRPSSTADSRPPPSSALPATAALRSESSSPASRPESTYSPPASGGRGEATSQGRSAGASQASIPRNEVPRLSLWSSGPPAPKETPAPQGRPMAASPMAGLPARNDAPQASLPSNPSLPGAAAQQGSDSQSGAAAKAAAFTGNLATGNPTAVGGKIGSGQVVSTPLGASPLTPLGVATALASGATSTAALASLRFLGPGSTAFASQLPSLLAKGMALLFPGLALGNQALPGLLSRLPPGAWIRGAPPGEMPWTPSRMLGMAPLALPMARPLQAMGWARQVERSMLDFAKLLGGEYLKAKNAETEAEEAMRDKLGLFVKRRLEKDKLKKLKSGRDIRQVHRKLDADWEERREKEAETVPE